jgi:MYXO-CTERM domain-containing protein
MRRAFLVFLFLFVALPAGAVDVWTTPFPGVRLLRRTTPQPVVLWAAVIDSCAPGIRFRVTAPSEGRRTTSSFGRLVGAQLAINGDFFDHDFGLNVGNGQVWSAPDTDHSGNFSVGANRLEMTPDYVVLPRPYPWVTEQLGGRWTLLHDGVPQLGIDDNGPAAGGFVCAPGLRHPRTAIGLSRDRRTVILLVADGRSSASIGMTCDEMIAVFRELGAHDAMGLDGGGSSTLWTSAGLVNRPSDASGERVVGDHLAVFASGSGAAPHCGLRETVVEPPTARAVTDAALPGVTPLTAPSRFRPMAPARLFDTRGPETSARLVRGDGSNAGPLALTSSGAFRDWAASGVPADATAVWLNVTAVGLQVPGYVTVFPHGRPRPETSNVNYEPTRAVANAVPVALGAMNQVAFEAHTAVELIADLAGSFAPTGAGLATIPPTRVLDTRTPAAPLRAGVTRAVDVRAPAGAVGVVASVAVIAGATAGYLTASPCGMPVPLASNLNYAPGDVVANAVVSGLGSGQLCLTSSADVDVVVDVTGHLSPTAPLSYVPLFPQRVLDTRRTTTPYAGRVGAGQVLTLPIQRLAGMPAAVGAVVANVTVTDAAAPGYVTTFPCGTSAPATSTLNFPADRAVGGLTSTAVGDGALCLFSSVRAHVIVDLLGVWVAAPPPMPDAGVTPPDASVRPDASAMMDVVNDVAADVATARDAVSAPDVTEARDVEPAEDADVAATDEGTREALTGSCGCRTQTEPRSRGWWWALVALVALRRRRLPALLRALDDGARAQSR